MQNTHVEVENHYKYLSQQILAMGWWCPIWRRTNNKTRTEQNPQARYNQTVNVCIVIAIIVVVAAITITISL